MTDRLKFNIQQFYDSAKIVKDKVNVDGVTINLPFISFNLSANNREKKIAREIIIRLRHSRVLNSKECCENCILNSLQSIIKIRELLVDRQVEIEKVDSTLFLLVDFALFGIKKFLTYTETFDPTESEQQYFESLHVIRGHLLRTLDQIAKIADLPTDFGFRYDYVDTWEAEVYLLTD